MQTQTEDLHKQTDCVQDLLSALQSSFHAFQDLFQVFKLSNCTTELHGRQKDPNITIHTSYWKNDCVYNQGFALAPVLSCFFDRNTVSLDHTYSYF